jgi:hypothetical protein
MNQGDSGQYSALYFEELIYTDCVFVIDNWYQDGKCV